MSAPLALDAEARELLFAIARFPEGRILQPCQVTTAQKLECMGLVSLKLTELQIFLDAFQYRPLEAVITEAGRRVVEGPALVRRAGQPVDPPLIAPRLRLPEDGADHTLQLDAAQFLRGCGMESAPADPPRDAQGNPLPRFDGGF